MCRVNVMQCGGSDRSQTRYKHTIQTLAVQVFGLREGLRTKQHRRLTPINPSGLEVALGLVEGQLVLLHGQVPYGLFLRSPLS